MADYKQQFPRSGVGAELASLTTSWPDFRNRVAQWNSGASNEQPTVETMKGFYGGVTGKDEVLYNELLKEFLAQALRDRSKPGSTIWDDPEVQGAANGPSRYTK